MSRASRSEDGFTLAESVVVVAIIALLSGLLVPVLSRVRESARTARCQLNLRQVGLAWKMYRQDYDGRNPFCLPTHYWPVQLRPYVTHPAVFQCPSATFSPRWGTHYAANTWGYSHQSRTTLAVYAPVDAECEAPTDTVGVLDWDGRHPSYPAIEGPVTDELFQAFLRSPETARHNGGIDVLFYDGHVKSLRPTYLQQSRLWTRWDD